MQSIWGNQFEVITFGSKVFSIIFFFWQLRITRKSWRETDDRQFAGLHHRGFIEVRLAQQLQRTRSLAHSDRIKFGWNGNRFVEARIELILNFFLNKVFANQDFQPKKRMCVVVKSSLAVYVCTKLTFGLNREFFPQQSTPAFSHTGTNRAYIDGRDIEEQLEEEYWTACWKEHTEYWVEHWQPYWRQRWT